MKSLDYSNFYKFYKPIDDRIYTFKNLDVAGWYKGNDDNESIENIKEIIEKVNTYNGEFKKVIAKIKKESQFNKKMKLNVETSKIKEEIQRLQDILSNQILKNQRYALQFFIYKKQTLYQII